MGKRGARPAPTQLKVLKGEKATRINQNEPRQRSGKCPAMPTWLSPVGKTVWRRLASSLHAAGLLGEWDAEQFALYCQAVAEYREAVLIVQETGVVITDAKGHGVKNPAMQVVRDQAQTIRAFAQEFGLTPSARSGITMPEQVEYDEARRLLS